jgi:hypothetical protein
MGPKGDIALVANSVTQVRETDKWKPVPNNKVYVFDLKANPPKHIGTVAVGKQPSGLSINKKGDLALVANRADNSITVYFWEGRERRRYDRHGRQRCACRHLPRWYEGTCRQVGRQQSLVAEIDGQKVHYEKYDMLAVVATTSPLSTAALASSSRSSCVMEGKRSVKSCPCGCRWSRASPPYGPASGNHRTSPHAANRRRRALPWRGLGCRVG